MNHRNIIRCALSFKNFVDNCFIDINNIENLPNVFLRSIGEIMMTNLKLHTFLKHAGCPREEGGDQIWTMEDKGERGVKKLNILLDVLCEWPLSHSREVSSLSQHTLSTALSMITYTISRTINTYPTLSHISFASSSGGKS